MLNDKAMHMHTCVHEILKGCASYVLVAHLAVFIHEQDNEYVHAIKSVGSVLAPYDTDQLIPVYGFGARMPDGQVSHCFPLNFNYQRPDVFGVQVHVCTL